MKLTKTGYGYRTLDRSIQFHRAVVLTDGAGRREMFGCRSRARYTQIMEGLPGNSEFGWRVQVYGRRRPYFSTLREAKAWAVQNWQPWGWIRLPTDRIIQANPSATALCSAALQGDELALVALIDQGQEIGVIRPTDRDYIIRKARKTGMMASRTKTVTAP